MKRLVTHHLSLVIAAAVAASVATTAAARTVGISSATDSALTLAFGDADGKAYTLAWGYGAADGGAATNAWDTFAILGTVAADATSQTVPLPANWGDTVKSLRFFLLAPETRPYATRLEYIESSGSQWIDTQVRGKVGVEAELDVTCVAMGDNTILGCRSGSGSQNQRFFVVHWANNKWGYGLETFAYWSTSADIATGTRYHVRNTIRSGEQSSYVDGAQKGSVGTKASSLDTGLNMYLFAANMYGSAGQQAKARIYSAKIWLDGDLKREFVPCKDGNGEACLYDLVSGAYFRNSGTGTFGEGAEIPLGLVVAATSVAHNWVSSNTLIVPAGAPMSLSADFSYDAVLLRDTLTLTGGTLTTPTVTVDGPGGGVEIDGGVLPSSAKLLLSPDVAAGPEYASVLTLRSGATTLECATNANADVAARIHFLGGWLRCTSFSGKPLCSANGGKWILEGTPYHPIRFGDLGQQRMDWLTGDGSVETRGHCDVLFDDSSYNAEHDYRGTIWLNTRNTTWNHTGDLVLSNAIDVVCRADDCLPSGPQTGGIRFTWVNRAGPPPPRLNLNGHSVAVNGIRGTEGYGVTNSASTIATLRIGEGDTVGSITNLILSGANINLVKRGAETNTVSLGGSSLAALRVEAGTLVVTGTTAEQLRAASITVDEGATLVIERTAVGADTYSGEGTVETLDGGTLEIIVGDDGTADTLIWDEPGFPSSSPFIKAGSNRAIVQMDASLAHDIDVCGGSLVFSGRTCTNEWYRFLFNGSTYGSPIQIAIGDLHVYSDTNKTENVANGIGANDNVLAAGTNPANLARGQCVAHFTTTTTKPEGQTNMNLHDLRNAFDDSAYNAVLSRDTFYIYKNASQTWVAFRMAAGRNRVQSYLPEMSYITWHWHPCSWLFQTSADGVNWITVDQQSLSWSDSSHSYGSKPYVIKGFLADGAAGFDPAANVRVAAGATLDASGVAGCQTLSRLTIDMTAGAGTIRGVTIAQNGIFDLVNVPAGITLHDITLPVTFLDITNGRNFTSWTVLVEGLPGSAGLPKWDAEQGTVSLFDGATLIQIR